MKRATRKVELSILNLAGEIQKSDPKRDAENDEARYWEPEYLEESEVNDEDLTRYYRNGVG